MKSPKKSGICALLLGIFGFCAVVGIILIDESLPLLKREYYLFASDFREGMDEAAKDYPGKKQFMKANANIMMYGGRDTAFGNTDEATRFAGEFSTILEQRCESSFTDGSSFNPTTGGHFLTYCRSTSGELVFLCHVPDLSSYHDNVREMLAGLAWSSAWKVAETENIKPGTPMLVGLAGFPGYGPIYEGAVGSPPKMRGDGETGDKRLYPYFIDGR